VFKEKMGARISQRLSRIERLIAALHYEPTGLPHRITERMRQVAGVARETGYRLRLGRVQQLPEDYRGERHVVITKHLPERYGMEWVEFQEVPGPAPKTEPQADSKQARYFTIRFIKPPAPDPP
jgi:hypothetical protein